MVAPPQSIPLESKTKRIEITQIIIIIIVTQGWVVNGVRCHAEPLGDNDPPQLCQRDAEYGYRNTLFQGPWHS
jgi:hypothetical protein